MKSPPNLMCRTRCAISAFGVSGHPAYYRPLSTHLRARGLNDKASAWAICERVAEAQALLHDHKRVAISPPMNWCEKLAALMAEEGSLRAMWEVGYFPPDTPPTVTIAGN